MKDEKNYNAYEKEKKVKSDIYYNWYNEENKLSHENDENKKLIPPSKYKYSSKRNRILL